MDRGALSAEEYSTVAGGRRLASSRSVQPIAAQV